MTLQRWERLTEWPMVISALVFLVVFSWQVIGQPTGVAGAIADALFIITWAMFIIDYVVSLSLAENRKSWFFRHIFDFIVVFLPMLRPVQVFRLFKEFRRLNQSVGNAVRGQIIVYAGVSSLLLIYTASLAVLWAERGSDSAIETFGNALWWSFVTVTTVGYGDMTPVTFLGRTVAVILMLGGIALVGVVTGTLSSWIVEKASRESEEDKAATVGNIHALEAKIDALTAKLEAASSAESGRGSGTSGPDTV